MNQDNQQFEQRVRAALDDGVGELDAATLGRLASMRVQACTPRPFLPRWLGSNYWLPAGALAAALIIAMVIALPTPPASSPEQPLVADADIMLEFLLDEDARDSDGDPDFYVWLDAVLAEEDSPHES